MKAEHSHPQKLPHHPLLMRFLGLYTLTLLVAAGAGWLVFHAQVQRELAELSVQEQAKTKIAAHILDDGIQQILGDLRVLAGSPGLREYLARSDARNLRRVANSYLNFARGKKIYDQIRYLDPTGMEVVRVNWNQGDPVVVAEDKLQNKGNRYYFRDAWQLEPGEIFISPLDLNIEHGQIEQPLKPMIRLATPVADDAGTKRGVVLVNYLAAQLLRAFRDHLDPAGGMLLNRDGYWLSAPAAADAWGFMFQNQRRFDRRYPRAWQAVSHQDGGTVHTEHGLFVFATAYPLRSGQRTSTGSAEAFAASGGALPWQEYYWKAVTHIPTPTLPHILSNRHAGQWLLVILALLLVALLEWMLVASFLARNRSRQALAESERRLREVTDTLAEGVYVLDPDGNIVFINQEACRLLGYASRAELLSRNAHHLFHHHHRDGHEFVQHDCPIYRSTRNGEVYRSEDDVFWHKEGSPLPVTVSASPILRHQQVTGTVVAFHDISERKQAEAYRRCNEERLRRLVELGRLAPELSEHDLCDRALDIAVDITHSQVGYLHFINNDQETINLVTWNSEARRHCTAAYDSHYPLSSAGVWADAARFKRPVIHNDYPNLAGKKGQPQGHFPLQRHMSAPVLDGDQVRMIIGVGNKPDLYDDNDMQQLQLVADEVEKIIMRRRAEAALAKAKEAAEAANIAKSEFLANMSHEIRTPMNAILGFAEVLHEQIHDPAQQSYLTTIRKSGETLLTLINDILDLSKIEAGKLELEYQPAALSDLLYELESLFNYKLRSKGVEFRMAVAPGLPAILVLDSTRLRQVLLNLLGNAVKFTAQGHICVRAGFVWVNDAHDRVSLTLAVEDTGIGIPPDQQAQVFDAFVQQQGQSQARYGGTGLGLPITKRLVEMMGGHISLHSVPGQGSTFSVVLPAVEVPAVAGACPLAADFDPAAIRFASATVLVADDIKVNRVLLRAFLQDYHFNLLEVENGEEAVRVAKQEQPALILMDMKMPVMDGYTATRILKADPATMTIPVLAVTASAMKEDEAALRDLCDGYITKPIDKAGLVETLTGFLEYSDISR